MSKRIPPKGTVGHRTYWMHRHAIDGLRTQRDSYLKLSDEVCTPAERPTCTLWSTYFSVYQYIDEAVRTFEADHKEFDYFSLNKGLK